MESMSLKSMNVQALNNLDACEINGGWKIPVPSIIKKLTPAAVALWIIDNWEEFKKGAYDGFNLQ